MIGFKSSICSLSENFKKNARTVCKIIKINENSGGKQKNKIFIKGIKIIFIQEGHLCKKLFPFLYEKNEYFTKLNLQVFHIFQEDF